MAEYFAGGHLRFVNGEWRDDNGDAIEISRVRHGRWIFGKDLPYSWGQIPKNKYHLYCSECLEQAFNRSEDNDPDFDVDTSYCPNCGAKMDGGNGNSDMARTRTLVNRLDIRYNAGSACNTVE